MGWSADRFFPAMARHGMLVPATSGASAGQVGFVRPDVMMLADAVDQPQYVIEFVTSEFPAIDAGATITVGDVQYTVRGHPRRQGDGYFSVAALTKV